MNDDLGYGFESRLRLAASARAAAVSDRATALVPTHSGGWPETGELVEEAFGLVHWARELLALAVACERQRGTSWEVVREALGGISWQAAQERYGAQVAKYEEVLLLAWLLGRDGVEELAEGSGTIEGVWRLDEWAEHRRGPRGALRPSGDGVPGRAVSAGLAPMSVDEARSRLEAAAAIIERVETTSGVGAVGRHNLRLGHTRRKVEVYEALLAEERAQPGWTGESIEDLEDALVAARRRLMELQRPDAGA